MGGFWAEKMRRCRRRARSSQRFFGRKLKWVLLLLIAWPGEFAADAQRVGVGGRRGGDRVSIEFSLLSLSLLPANSPFYSASFFSVAFCFFPFPSFSFASFLFCFVCVPPSLHARLFSNLFRSRGKRARTPSLTAATRRMICTLRRSWCPSTTATCIPSRLSSTAGAASSLPSFLRR